MIFTTKANTLEVLAEQLTKSTINPLVTITFSAWQSEPAACLQRIQSTLKGVLAVRSSALGEDSETASNAGAYHSELGVSAADSSQLSDAIDRVFGSYADRSHSAPDNQVLIQEQSTDIVLSGVCTTRTLDGGPYYVIAYAEGKDTTAVTSGGHSRSVKISRFSLNSPQVFRPLMAAIHEIERCVPALPLDIEFGITEKGRVVIFQVRPLVCPSERPFLDAEFKHRIDALKSRVEELAFWKRGVVGRTTYLGDMTDWNPAEMIGDRSSELAFSLYDDLITAGVWSTARSSQGYYDVGQQPLVHRIGDKPYVDVRCCFNSFLPAGLPRSLYEKLIAFTLAKLHVNPSLQDKVEFEILFTCFDPSFRARASELLDRGFTNDEVAELERALLSLTNSLLTDGGLERDLAQTRTIDGLLKAERIGITPVERLTSALRLLDICREHGTLPFARLARLAFIAKAILKALVPTSWTEDQYEAFFHSIHTVARDLQIDTARVSDGSLTRAAFLAKYGHLRPGTYDITSLRYDEQEIAFADTHPRLATVHDLPKPVIVEIEMALRNCGLQVSAEHLFEFCRRAFEGREEAKFQFTKLLSRALSLIADVGADLGFSRSEMAHLDMGLIRQSTAMTPDQIVASWRPIIESRRRQAAMDALIELPPVLFSLEDFDIIFPFDSRPTFITQKSVTAKVIHLGDDHEMRRDSVRGKIVLLERGDPGYDWIFTQEPAGLVTRFGGAGSHMAIRCNEFSLPAAIGCGDELFKAVLASGEITLDCRTNAIRTRILGEPW